MKRENPKRTLTQENVMEYFLQRTLQNLHVVFCFSPVSNFIRLNTIQKIIKLKIIPGWRAIQKPSYAIPSIGLRLYCGLVPTMA